MNKQGYPKVTIVLDYGEENVPNRKVVISDIVDFDVEVTNKDYPFGMRVFEPAPTFWEVRVSGRKGYHAFILKDPLPDYDPELQDERIAP